MNRRIVIVGGVAGGMSAATRLRRLDEDADIVVLERSGNVSFANCGLPYHVGGVIERRSSLLLQTPESLRTRFGLDVRVRHEVVGIDAAARTVEVRDLDDDTTYVLGYDELVLSPGARPVRPPLPGIERALSLRDVEDADALVAAVAGAHTAVVVGGGFIGIELAENLVHRGIRVALVEATPQVMAPLDPELASLVHDRLKASGVDLRLGSAVASIGSDDVTLADGSVLPADLVVAAIGVRPESGLAKAAGLRIGERGGILVDDRFATSDPHIHAVGDAVEKSDALDGQPALVPLAQTANLQGRLVADAIMGRPVRGRGVLGTAVVGVFGLQVAATGWNEKRLRGAGRSYRVIHTHPADHAGYYPGAVQMALKLLVDPATDRILGAQGVGEAGVDKRIDVIATAMANDVPASGLAELELAYAPQFASAKDPVNMLGWVASDMRDGLVETIQWHEVADAVAAGATVLDVRTEKEHRDESIPGSVLIPLDELRGRLGEVPSGEVVVHCAVGLRGYLATRILEQRRGEGSWTRVRNLDGGMKTWLAGQYAESPSRP
ncbi:FAD-dependent oxidoreductase [Brooklawnia cerclae]|uniref:NADPH-dependent 2,4-dienoyl-CoA reductase/sulfur reductase-like enzyme/rhodanese-related sulfurtransferase n=1 Tax=Brooklawnia cerclae TaxID=349934 RepID=A0ABX0SFV0_9ACTN|nr:FAD-dependent oxidoreductase [Brooklawnia cerclae]NIH55626.1 NADPH-dependent 2,4-dienoyl-CoA reductase/sulfur reductase-like enzyme/rhodanese-related sulfurtransferase [Brooklawnia cerclae]